MIFQCHGVNIYIESVMATIFNKSSKLQTALSLILEIGIEKPPKAW